MRVEGDRVRRFFVSTAIWGGSILAAFAPILLAVVPSAGSISAAFEATAYLPQYAALVGFGLGMTTSTLFTIADVISGDPSRREREWCILIGVLAGLILLILSLWYASAVSAAAPAVAKDAIEIQTTFIFLIGAITASIFARMLTQGVFK